MATLNDDVAFYVLAIRADECAWDEAAQNIRDDFGLTYLELIHSGIVKTLQGADKNWPPALPCLKTEEKRTGGSER